MCSRLIIFSLGGKNESNITTTYRDCDYISTSKVPSMLKVDSAVTTLNK